MSIILYERKLLNELTIEKTLSDIYYGVQRPRDITLQFDNSDGHFTTLLATEEFRGKKIKLQTYDPNETPAFELYAVITDFNLTDVAEFTVSVQDPDPFQTLLPTRVVQTDDFPIERPVDAWKPAEDLGKAYPLIFGHAKRVPLRYIHALQNVCYFYTTHAGGGGDEWTYWNIWAGFYTIQSGDYLEYDIYCHRDNPGFVSGVEIIGSGWSWDGQGNSLADQNGIDNVLGDISSYANDKWYSRKVDLTAVVGNVIANVLPCVEDDTGGSYKVYYKNIRITDGSGNVRQQIWSGGAFVADSLNDQQGASNYGIEDIGFYDYIVGYGPIENIDTIYRNQVLVDTSEYEVWDGSQTSQYSGFAFIRFTKVQRDYSNSLYQLSADVKGLVLGGATAERNFATIIKHILSNTTWGLSLSVNDGIFTNAATIVSSLYCDGNINTQRRAQDIINVLLMVQNGWIEENESQERELYYDSYISWDAASFGDNDGYYDNIIKISKHGKTAKRDAIKTYILKYRRDEWAGEYMHQNSRDVLSFGNERVKENPFVRDHETADRITCYQQKRLQQIDNRILEITVGMEGRHLRAGHDVVRCIVPRWDILSTERFFVQNITKRLTSFDLKLYSYDSGIYTYTPGTMPPDETDSADTTPPAAPANLTATAAIGAINLSWDAPSDLDVRYYEVYRNTSNDSATATKISDSDSITYTNIGITDYVQTYYYWVKAVDFHGNKSSFSDVASAMALQVEGGAGNGDIGDDTITDANIQNLNADKITAGVLYINDGSVCHSSYGGDKYGNRDGQTYWYDISVGNWMAIIGESSVGSYIARFRSEDVGSHCLFTSSGPGKLALEAIADFAGANEFSLMVGDTGCLRVYGNDTYSSALSGSVSLPSTCAGFMKFQINGVDHKIPFFN